jgi:hypothetical protein
MGTILGLSSRMVSIDPNEPSFNDQINATIAQGVDNNASYFPSGARQAFAEQTQTKIGALTSDILPVGEYMIPNAYLLADGDVNADANADAGGIEVGASYVVPSTAMLLGNVLGGILAYQMTANRKGRVWWTIGGVIAGGIATSLAYNVGRGFSR